MKLRLKENTIRIRLSMNEVEKLVSAGQIASKTMFPGMNALVTQIHLGGGEIPTISFENGRIAIDLPEKSAKGWPESDQVGFEWSLALHDGSQLSLLIEKDFRCLTERPGEDESALYPNPNQAHG
jgi:hypothetical protein